MQHEHGRAVAADPHVDRHAASNVDFLGVERVGERLNRRGRRRHKR